MKTVAQMHDRGSLRKGDKNHELEVVKNKLEETTLLLEVLSHVNAKSSTSNGFEEFCNEVCKILNDKLNFNLIYIWIRDEKNPDILKLVTTNLSEKGRTLDVRQGMVGKCIREMKTICAPDVKKEVDYLNSHPTTVSEICIPLIDGKTAIGAINVESETYNDFQKHRMIMEIIADNMSHSIKLAMLYKTEKYFHFLVDHMSEGVWVNDAEQKVSYINPAMERMLKNELLAVKGTNSYDYCDSESRRKIVEENQKRTIGISSRYEAKLVAHDGEKIPVLIHGVPFGEGGNMATIMDLREIKETEGRLRNAERYLATITKFCPEAIVGLKSDQTVVSWNAAAQTMFGYKAEEIINKNINIIVPGERLEAGELDQIIAEIHNKGVLRNYETTRLHKNGKPLNVSLTFSALKNDHGEIIGYAGLYRDITVQKKWEQDLQDRFEKIQEAYKEMGRQRRYLDYLSDMIDLSTDPSTTLKQMANFIVNSIVVITKVSAATLRIYNREDGRLYLAAQAGLGEEWWTTKAMPYQGSIVEKAIGKGIPIKILDIHNEPTYHHKALAMKNNLRSALFLPLTVKGQIIASLALYLTQEGNLNLLDDEFIGIFAKQAAVALKMASSTLN